jgi:hypothetical protein
MTGLSQAKRKEVCQIARDLGMHTVPDDWSGIDPVVPLIERMRQDGAIVLIKFDGERTGPGDSGSYTFAVSGGRLGDDYVRIDSGSIETGLAYIIAGYFESAGKA